MLGRSVHTGSMLENGLEVAVWISRLDSVAGLDGDSSECSGVDVPSAKGFRG